MKWPALGRLFLLLLTLLPVLTACHGGGESGASSADHGAIAFGLKFQDAKDASPSRAASFDCQANGIATIEAKVYDGDDNLLKAGGPWACDAGQGTITAVAAGTGHTLVVLAREEEGNLLYQGEKTVDVEAGTVTNAGTVACAHFAPSPRTPAAGALAVTGRIRFTWETVEGAAAYRIRVSLSEDMADPLVDETTSHTSHTPTELEDNQTYYWQVSALDAYGHEGSTGAVMSVAATARVALVKEVTPRTASSAPENLTAVDGKLYFSAQNTEEQNQAEYLGRELWMSDGTPSGTVLLKDIDPGPGSGEPVFLTDVRDTLFFLANGSELWRVSQLNNAATQVGQIDALDHSDSRPVEAIAVDHNLYLTIYNGAANTYELWCSDGGTTPVLIRAVDAENLPDWKLYLTAVDDLLYFVAFDDTHGLELWRSDGTEAGTVLVMDIRPGSEGSSPKDLTAFGDTLYFSADDGIHGRELWKSGGSATNTSLVKDIYSGSGLGPRKLTIAGDTLFFSAFDSRYGVELWKSDGTDEGTVLVEDINPGSSHSLPNNLTEVGGNLYFTANEGTSGDGLWRSDGTDEGAVLVKHVSPVNLTAVGDTLFFTIDAGPRGHELWKSDGTTEGTVQVKEIGSVDFGPRPNNFTAIGDSLYFTADDGSHGEELWKSDGTVEGTVMVRDIDTSGREGNLGGLTSGNGNIVFTAYHPDNGFELWRSDGTVAGTDLIKDIQPGAGSALPYPLFAGADGRVFFAADDGSGAGRELWQSDGTAEGTKMVKDIFAGVQGSSPEQFVPLDTDVFFIADDGVNGKGLWRTDGSGQGTELILGPLNGRVHDMARAGNHLLFSLYDTSSEQLQLWRSDGSSAGTEMLRVISVDVSGIERPKPYTKRVLAIGDSLYFVTRVGIGGLSYRVELWRSDGTAEGTIRVKRLASAADFFTTEELAEFDGKLYFTAEEETTGRELWMTDGSPEGTVLVKDINTGEGDSDPGDLVVLGDRLYFGAEDGMNGRELWMTDGTDTAMVEDIFAGETGSGVKNLFSLNDTLFFQADDGTHGRELWESDGTAGGTRLAADINPGANHGEPGGFIAFNGMLLFVAYDGEHGSELWRCIP